MSGRRALRLGAALLCLAVAVGLGRTAQPRRPGAAELLGATGLVRGLVVPFLWIGLGEAAERHELEATLSHARMLLRVVPEYESLWLALAQRHVYEASPRERTPAAQAERLIEALLLLREAAERHPADPDPHALTAFLLADRCLGDEPLTRDRCAAFVARTGIDPVDQASRSLQRAGELAGRPIPIDAFAPRFAAAMLEAGQRELAATLLERGAALILRHPPLEADARAAEAARADAYLHWARWLRSHPVAPLPEALQDLLSRR